MTRAWFCCVLLVVVLVPALGRNVSEIESSEPVLSGDQNRTLQRNNSGLDGSAGVGDRFVELLTVFNARHISRAWDTIGPKLTRGCKEDMETYLHSLDTEQLWALKALDASGRYSTGFFWGNNYWTGSETLCSNIDFHRKHYDVGSAELPTGARATFHKDEPSPFSFGFYKVKARLELPDHIAPVRVMLLGLCLPYQCTAADVHTVLSSLPDTPVNYNSTAVQILGVRTPHEYYVLWEDQVFWLLAGVTALVVVLLFTGTTYDFLREKTSQQNIQPFNVTVLLNGRSKTSNSIAHSFGNNRVGPGLDGCGTDSATKLDASDSSLSISDNDRSSVGSDPDLGVWWQGILMAFSIRENLKTICDKSVGSDTLPTVHGLRSISMAWVILGHTCIVIFKYSDNLEYRAVIERQIIYQAIVNGSFAVDTFFFISGLLVSFLYFRTTARVDVNAITGAVGFRSNALQFVGLLIYRFFRLTVPYMFVLGCVQVFMKYFYYNSVFDPPTNDHDNCPNYWWRNALYINTLFPVQQMCMLWSWYLADDTQFYILGIVILIVAVSHQKTAASLVLVFLASSWITTAYIAFTNEHMPSQNDPLALFDKIFDKPWTRLGPYLIGMVVGWVLFKTECKIRMNKAVVVIGWVVSLAGLTCLVYGLYESDLDKATSAAYSSLSHSAWALCLSWVVIACSTGQGGVINMILSTSVLYPFSRVTYCAYLIHPLVIRSTIVNLDTPLHLNNEVVMYLFFGQVVISYTLAFIISLAFEAPVVSLLRLISPTRASKTAP